MYQITINSIFNFSQSILKEKKENLNTSGRKKLEPAVPSHYGFSDAARQLTLWRTMDEVVEVKYGPSTNVPASVEAAMAANKPSVEDSGRKPLRIRIQLLMMYGALTIFAFLLLLLAMFFSNSELERIFSNSNFF